MNFLRLRFVKKNKETVSYIFLRWVLAHSIGLKSKKSLKLPFRDGVSVFFSGNWFGRKIGNGNRSLSRFLRSPIAL